MDQRYLTTEEKAEQDALMIEAGFNSMTGERYPQHQIKERVLRFYRDAIQAKRKWAEYALDDAAADGCLRAWNRWDNGRKRIAARVGDQVVVARSTRGTRQRDDAGNIVHQRIEWHQMSWSDVQQQIADADARIAAERVTKVIALRLLSLLIDAPDSAGPGDACELLGLNFDEFLIEEAAA